MSQEPLIDVESHLMLHPDHVPVIIERDKHCKDLPDIENNKFFVPKDLTIGNFIYIIRKRVKINETDAIFVFVNKVLPSPQDTLGFLYDQYKSSDKTLHCTYSSDHSYG